MGAQANLASILVQTQLSFDVNSLEDALQAGGTFCVMASSESTLINLYPSLKGRTVPFSTWTTQFEGLKAGNCSQVGALLCDAPPAWLA